MFKNILITMALAFSLNVGAQTVDDYKNFSFAGHFLAVNDLPAPLTLKLFDFQLSEGDQDDAKVFAAQLEKLNYKLISKNLYYEIKEGKPTVVAFVQSIKKSTIELYILNNGQSFLYNVSGFSPATKTIVSIDPAGNYGTYTYTIE